MPNLTETATYDATIIELETTDPVQGGPGAISNSQAQHLANRTAYLKQHMDAAEAAIATLEADVAADPPTAAAGADDTSAATTAFVHRNSGGFVVVDCAGAGNITLTSDQWGCAVIILTGARTANGNVIFPTRTNGDRWLVANRTTGAYALTCKTAAGAGVTVGQTLSKDIWCDGTDILNAETDLSTRPITVTSATTMVAGGSYTVDFSGGTFGMTLPASPGNGDQCKVRGNFFASNLTVSRNGHAIYDQNGVAQTSDYVANRNNVSLVFTYVVPSTGTAGWLVTLG